MCSNSFDLFLTRDFIDNPLIVLSIILRITNLSNTLLVCLIHWNYIKINKEQKYFVKEERNYYDYLFFLLTFSSGHFTVTIVSEGIFEVIQTFPPITVSSPITAFSPRMEALE